MDLDTATNRPRSGGQRERKVMPIIGHKLSRWRVIFEHLVGHVDSPTFTMTEKMEEKEGRKECWEIIVNTVVRWCALPKILRLRLHRVFFI